MLAHKQQDIQATLSEPEPALDPMTLERLQEAIGDLTPILQTALQVTPARCTRLRLAAERVIASLTAILATGNRHFQHSVASP